MGKERRVRVSGRGMVSLLTAFSFMVLAITGLVLFITPPGRVANWTGWRFLGLTKSQWGALHIWFALTFLITSGFHIYLNWRPLINYFKSRVTRRFVFRPEWMAALLACFVLFVSTLAEVPPFSSLLTWNESIKEGWEREDERPPIPHAELLTLKDLAAETGADLDSILANLKADGIQDAIPGSVMDDLAKAHGMTPNALFEIAVRNPELDHSKIRQSGAGVAGPGRKTLTQICAERNLDVARTLKKLHAANVEAEADMILRDIATRNGIKPPELLELIGEQ